METFWVAVDELITCLIAHLHVFHPVVVFRIADTDGRTHDQPRTPFHKLRIQIGTMCMKGTDTVGGIQEIRLFRFGNDIDSTTQCIHSQ